MNDEAHKQAAWSAVRTLLAAVGAWMATHKYIDADAVNEIVGAVMIIGPLVWGVWDKYKTEAKTKAREAVAVNVGIAVADRTAGLTAPVPPANVPAVIEAFAPVAPAAANAPANFTGLAISPSSPVLPDAQPKGTT